MAVLSRDTDHTVVLAVTLAMWPTCLESLGNNILAGTSMFCSQCWWGEHLAHESDQFQERIAGMLDKDSLVKRPSEILDTRTISMALCGEAQSQAALHKK